MTSTVSNSLYLIYAGNKRKPVNGSFSLHFDINDRIPKDCD